MDKKEYITLALVAAMFVSAIVLLPGMPDKVPMHWNAEGQVDGYGDPWTVFITPIAALFVYGMFFAIPKIAVRKKNVLDFYEKHGFGFRFVFIAFMAAIHAVILLSALGTRVEMNFVMPFMLGGLFIYLGYIMPDVKRNYFIGFRTPWALADDRVWKKTHEFGGKAFMISGAAFLLWGLVGGSMLAPMAILLFLVLAVVAYSYKEYKKKHK
ncbi:MAG: SdpI family protein [Candidatus Diapherotrites archaeon]|nr:SdpI family protein [Candidatus Diapherotrites archaeon]